MAPLSEPPLAGCISCGAPVQFTRTMMPLACLACGELNHPPRAPAAPSVPYSSTYAANRVEPVKDSPMATAALVAANVLMTWALHAVIVPVPASRANNVLHWVLAFLATLLPTIALGFLIRFLSRRSG